MVDLEKKKINRTPLTWKPMEKKDFIPLPPLRIPAPDSLPSKKSSPIDRLRQKLKFRNREKENRCTTKTKPLQWQNDENNVRVGTCSFNVKYLGSIEVQESRGMHVCEQAIQALLNQKNKHIQAILHISGDALRVVDETNKGLIIDQTIEKVSFCAPDRYHDKGFAYICRDGTTRRWICHGFLAIKDAGERLSHTVGCAFQICLERKQKRDRECNVTVEYTQNGTSFTRFGSFRTTSITERMIDPQSAMVADPIPCTPIDQKNNNIIERPRPKGNNSDAFNRSASMRTGDFNQMTTNTCKRQSSLRQCDLPSIQEAKYKNSLPNTIPEELEVPSTLSLFDSTNSQSIILSTRSINDAFNSNLNALVQSSHPINPFSPYSHSIAAQSQTSDRNSRQSIIFTPKRGTNPFNDDFIRR